MNLKKKKNLRKVAKLLYFFLKLPGKVQSNSFNNCIYQYNVKILNLFNPELKLINTKAKIKNKLRRFLNEWKKCLGSLRL